MALTAKCVAVVALTTIGPLAPVMLLVVWSVAVSVWLPAVVKVALKVPTPLVNPLLAGNKVAAPWSLLLNPTMPEYPVAVLLNWSSAVTVKPTLLPAIALAGAVTAKCVAVVALTVIVVLAPVIDPLIRSVAVSAWPPAVVKVALNVPTPLVSGLAAGSNVEAPWSLLVNDTVPVYALAVLLNWSWAVTVNGMPLPAMALPGAVTAKCVAVAALTATGPLNPVILDTVRSVAVSV